MDTATYHTGDFGAEGILTSCDLEHRPGSEGATITNPWHEGSGREWLSDDVLIASRGEAAPRPALRHLDADGVDLTRADPNTKYVIDVAYIVDDGLIEAATIDWEGYITDMTA